MIPSLFRSLCSSLWRSNAQFVHVRAGWSRSGESQNRQINEITIVAFYSSSPNQMWACQRSLLQQSRKHSRMRSKHCVIIKQSHIYNYSNYLLIFRYSRRAIEIKSVLENKPYSSKELLLKHVEFAGKFGAAAG